MLSDELEESTEKILKSRKLELQKNEENLENVSKYEDSNCKNNICKILNQKVLKSH